MIVEQFCHPAGAVGALIGRMMGIENRSDYDLCLGALKPQAGERMLEIGMGCGAQVPALLAADVRYLGIDHSETMVAMARMNAPTADFLCADICTTPIPNVDCALAVNTLMWWSDPEAGLRNLRSAARLAIGIVPPGAFPYVGQRYYSADELCKMLRAVGFSDVLVKQHDTPRRPYLVGVAQ